MQFSEENKEISSALGKAWSAIETPKHNSTVSVKMKTGGSYTFAYTDLGGIFDAAREVFKENGIAIMQNSYTEITPNGSLACVETMLLHSSGEWVKSSPLKFPAAGGMQDFGGQITYMKRYSLSAMLGIATEKDDDANGASGNSYDYSSGGRKQTTIPKTAQEAAAITLTFGKHNGQTLKELWTKDIQYLDWLEGNDKTDPAIKTGIQLMRLATKTTA